MSTNADEANNQNNSYGFEHYDDLSEELLRTMRITTNARFEAAKRLRRINSICFLSTTLASLGLILIPLLDIAGHNKVFTNSSLTVFQIFLAVCVLVYSATISTANFAVRSKEFLECGDKIKSIVNDFKFHLMESKGLDQPPELKKYTELYSKVLIGTENHEDIDYFKSLSIYNKKQKKEEKPDQKWFMKWIFLPIISFFLSKDEIQIKIISTLKIYMPFFILMFLEVIFIGDMLSYWNLLGVFHKNEYSLANDFFYTNLKFS